MRPSNPTLAADEAAVTDREGFSLVLGGPLYQLLLKTRLARPPLQLMHRRMVLIPALAWLPLLMLSLYEGRAFAGVTVPFLKDGEAYARFLVAMPVLLLAELIVHQRLRHILAQFRERDIVTSASQPLFEDAIAAAMRLRNSITAEVVLLAIVFLVGPALWKNNFALKTDTWYGSVEDGRTVLTWAGTWFVYVSAPVFQFLLLRWYFRLAIWWRFLWQVSRMPLHLEPLHPDRAGGVGFLGGSLNAFAPVLIAQSVVLSGIVFSRVLTGAGNAMDYRGEIAMLVIFLVAQIVVPLLFFSPDLMAARREGVRRFGLLAMRYARDFERRWLQESDAPEREALLGSGDIQSLNDLAGANDVVREMRPVPFDLRMIIRLVLVTAAPFLPLVLTVIPFDEVMQRLAQMIL